MNLRFIGTGFGPLKTKRKNTKDYRRPASLLIDDSILIDPTPSVFEFADDYALSGLYRKVHTVLLTSLCEERFSLQTLLELSKSGQAIEIYGPEEVRERIPAHPLLHFHPVLPNRIFDIENAKVISLPTLYKDAQGNSAMGYAICTDRSLLYMIDGGFLHPEAWELLKKLHFDHAVFGCPSGDAPSGAATVEKSNFELARMLRSVFLDAKTISPASRCFLSAIPTDKKRSIHDALGEISKDSGFTLAYDGLYMNI